MPFSQYFAHAQALSPIAVAPSPSGRSLHLHPAAPASSQASWRWVGTLIARPLAADFPEGELRRIMAGGSTRHLRHPDAVNGRGAPVFLLTDRQRRERDRLLDRLAVAEGFERAIFHNVACNQGRNNLLQLVAGASSATYTGAQYTAVGTGAGTPQTTDTQLFTEFFRKLLSSTSVSSNQALLNVLFNTGEANGTYTEAALIGSDNTHTATGTANTGMLYGHSLFTYTKTSAIQLSIGYYIQLT